MKAYKLFRTKKSEPGKLYPLFVNANKETPIGVWIDAEEGERKENGKVKSKLGDLHYRPGWHCSADVPYETHIGVKGESGKIEFLNPDYVWCEVEISDEISYQDKANENGMNKNGILIKKNADLDYIPVNGYYRYKTNPNMWGEWIIAGSIKVVKILNDQEVFSLCSKFGLTPLPRYSGN